MARYELNKGRFDFRKSGPGFWGVVGTVFKYLALSLTLAVVYYVVIALVVTKDTDAKIARENRMYEKLYPQMRQREKLVGDVIESLQARDGRIYREIFNAEAPAMDPLRNLESFATSDTLPDEDYVRYAYRKSEKALAAASTVEDNFRSITSAFVRDRDTLPPLSIPLESMSYAQVGASVGEKVNPFYKLPMRHNGIDLIAPQGDPVLAVADGTVTDVILSRKGLGNVVEITHSGGYVSRYCHLSDIEVRTGQRVKRGRKIACVGISGSLFAPHLHFEMLRRGEYLDPVHFFFASVSPDEYANMLYMSANTGQSLD